MPDSIYARPADYDLEHEHDDEDVRFYRRLVSRVMPRRLLELGCGSGRVLVPVAESRAMAGARIVGVDLARDMLAEARRKLDERTSTIEADVSLVEHDIRTYAEPRAHDLVIVPCSTLCHVLELEDQLQLWASVRSSLCPGGRFVADVTMPNLPAFADSLQTPPRALVERDIDSETADGTRRLLRYKTTVYDAHRQRARVHFLYDRFQDDARADRYVSDFESHVYFPRELELLFRISGFTVEATFGDYCFGPLRSHSRTLVMVGRLDG